MGRGPKFRRDTLAKFFMLMRDTLYLKSLTYRFVDLRQAYMYVWNNHVNEYGIEEASTFYKKKLKVITFYITHAWIAM